MVFFCFFLAHTLYTFFAFSTQALSLVVLQMLELMGVLLLLRYPGKPQYKLRDFFQEKQSAKERNWLFASALGFGFLVLLVFTTSIIADWLIGTKVSCLCFLFQMQYQIESWNAYCINSPWNKRWRRKKEEDKIRDS